MYEIAIRIYIMKIDHYPRLSVDMLTSCFNGITMIELIATAAV